MIRIARQAAALAFAALCVTAIAADAGPRGRAAPTPLEWLLDSQLTGTRVRPTPKASFYWRADSTKPIAGASLEVEDLGRLDGSRVNRIRARVAHTTAEIAVYVDRAQLMVVASRTAIVCPSRACALGPVAPETPGVHLQPGEPIARVHGKIGPLRRVSIADEVIAATGLIAADKIDIEYRPAKAAARRELPTRGIRGKVVVRDRPGGAAVATLTSDDELSLEVGLIRTRDSAGLIRYVGEHSVVVGWVPLARLSDEIFGGLGGFGLRGGGHRISLPRGTVLHDARGGEAIGLLVRDARLGVSSRDGDWTEVEVPTGIGAIEAWVSSERMVIEPDD